MTTLRSMATIAVTAAVLTAPSRPAAQHVPRIAQYLKPGLPIELVSAVKADRVGWLAYEEGKRNVFTAAAPDFKAVRVTSFLKDDGVDISQLRMSDDGLTFVFVRGSAPNSIGWVANPTSDPGGAERAIWAARVGTPAWRLAEGSAPVLAPDGSSVLYTRDGQIYRARVTRPAGLTKIDKGETPFITAWGTNSGPRWSPDGRKIAFVSNRVDHSFIGVYDLKTRTVSWVAPSVDRDSSPAWSPDGKSLVFLRRPGLPYGQQTQPANGGPTSTGRAAAAGGRAGGAGAFSARGAGNAAPPAARAGGTPAAGPTPTAPAQPAPAVPTASSTPQTAAPVQPPANPGGRQGGGRGQRGAGDAPIPAAASPLNANSPGLYRAAFEDGSTLTLWRADVASAEAHQIWRPAPDDPAGASLNTFQWANDSLVFQFQPQNDEWERYWSLSLKGDKPAVRLTTTDGIIEDATAVTLSKDGKTLFYCTNAGDIDRRHIWAVSTSGGTPWQVTTGDGIENVPVALASGKQIAVLSADAKRPMSVGIWPVAANDSTPAARQHVVYPTLGADFPLDQEVVPTNVTLKPADGAAEFHNQLFLPKNMRPGEKHPALIFVHGGPQRQMLLGYHYLSFYHVFYAVNQWLTSQGYIVLSVNYRSGVGYGRSFRGAANTGTRGTGNSEYQDVLAAGKWLAARDDVDPARVGIWGLSYGGLLTSEALARNSDIFKAGVDLAGVHLEGSSLDPAAVSYTASAVSQIDNWKSPVLLIHGDDDRNVEFSNTVGLVQLLRARHIYHELIVFPDDVHETLLHKRWLYTFDRMETFLNKFLSENAATRSAGK